MSWLSHLLGLDSHPAELAAINAVGQTVLNNIEATNPVAAALINVVEELDKTKVNTPASAVSAVGTVVAVLDPQWVTQLESAINSILTKAGVPAALEQDLDTLIEGEFKAIGLVK